MSSAAATANFRSGGLFAAIERREKEKLAAAVSSSSAGGEAAAAAVAGGAEPDQPKALSERAAVELASLVPEAAKHKDVAVHLKRKRASQEDEDGEEEEEEQEEDEEDEDEEEEADEEEDEEEEADLKSSKTKERAQNGHAKPQRVSSSPGEDAPDDSDPFPTPQIWYVANVMKESDAAKLTAGEKKRAYTEWCAKDAENRASALAGSKRMQVAWKARHPEQTALRETKAKERGAKTRATRLANGLVTHVVKVMQAYAEANTAYRDLDEAVKDVFDWASKHHTSALQGPDVPKQYLVMSDGPEPERKRARKEDDKEKPAKPKAPAASSPASTASVAEPPKTWKPVSKPLVFKPKAGGKAKLEVPSDSDSDSDSEVKSVDVLAPKSSNSGGKHKKEKEKEKISREELELRKQGRSEDCGEEEERSVDSSEPDSELRAFLAPDHDVDEDSSSDVEDDSDVPSDEESDSSNDSDDSDESRMGPVEAKKIVAQYEKLVAADKMKRAKKMKGEYKKAVATLKALHQKRKKEKLAAKEELEQIRRDKKKKRFAFLDSKKHKDPR